MIAMRRFVVLIVLAVAGAGVVQAQKAVFKLIDLQATTETKNLATNLFRIAQTNILFGHQHATEYGHGWRGDADRSDVKSVTGSHPAVIGVDFMGLSGLPPDQIAANRQALMQEITATYNRGGLTTVAWHFSNPVSPGGFYWKDSLSLPAVPYLVPGGSHHDQYKEILKTIASVAHDCKGADGKLVPMVFRPFHELDGDWFWWGKSHCSTPDFIKLWRFTVEFLRDSLQVHNFIYAFSPDNRFNSEEEYLERYPGDAWVDLVGVDNYGDFGRDGKYDLAAGLKKLQIVSGYAVSHHKLAAFTETGLESIPNDKWWTSVLLRTLKDKQLALCYVLVWRNDEKSPTHFYAPFPGQISAPDFMRFYADPFTLFEADLQGKNRLYQSRRKD
ncbi:MAG: glycoside hydrolase family 26 protein [Bacteroidetes bacterium]|nr:glycoside hydrolase family 26 protein [Bacteroidota bacterium]